MFKSKSRKQVDLTRKALRKFVNYKRDLLKPEQLDELRKMDDELAAVAGERDAEKIKAVIKDVDRRSSKMMPATVRATTFLGENVEVFFVVIAVMIGIRAFIMQPFKIPTNSMYPTLNGMRAQAVDGELPNIASRGFQRVWNGRNYLEIVAPFDGVIAEVKDRPLIPFLPLITVTDITYLDPNTGREEMAMVNTSAQALGDAFDIVQGRPVRQGQVLAKGYSQAGDQLLVNKMAYHFRQPKRGEVYVFVTKGLDVGIQDPRVDQQHYIKRLVAVPGDSYAIENNKLLINGGEPDEFGMARVNAAEDDYHGYFSSPTSIQPVRESERSPFLLVDPEGNLVKISSTRPVKYPVVARVPERHYVSMGDNSGSSLDSRYWGFVPEENLVGPALFVYFPFGNHFGAIR